MENQLVGGLQRNKPVVVHDVDLFMELYSSELMFKWLGGDNWSDIGELIHSERYDEDKDQWFEAVAFYYRGDYGEYDEYDVNAGDVFWVVEKPTMKVPAEEDVL